MLQPHLFTYPLKKSLRKPFYLALFLTGSLLLAFLAYHRTNKPHSWTVRLRDIGTASSPRLVDLTGDGVKDILLGAGGKENQPSDTAVIALDGTNGNLLWRVPGQNQLVGSAVWMDITQDGVPDVFIGGRSAELMAIDGKKGQVLWRFFPQRERINPADSGWFNFFNPQFIPDQDGDQLPDLLIANGGDARIPPHDPKRPIGNLLIISSKTGKILAKAPVPDGRETYSSPVWADIDQDGNPEIIFGTGGETLGGHLYRATLRDLLRGDLSTAIELASSPEKGFISPAILVDITGDAIQDIVVNAVEGRMIAINGATNAVIWQVVLSGTEAYSTPAVGFFNGDAVPDFFANYGIGIWPQIQTSVELMVDGKTGAIQRRDTLGNFQYASPVAYDLDADGFDEALLTVNSSGDIASSYEPFSYLSVFNFRRNTLSALGDSTEGANIACTPWIGTLDGNGTLDIVYTVTKFWSINNDIDQPAWLTVKLIRTPIPVHKPILWGAYMGSQFDGIFQRPAEESTVAKQIR